MRQPRRTMPALAVLLAGLFACGAAGAVELHTGDRNLLLRQGNTLELPSFDARERRRDFQDQQQRFREQDRLTIGKPQQRLEIPVIRRNCQVQPFGNNFLRSCR